ncbi:hypothetical protein NLX83_36560 [Allokutzneria sp. A3M-2-11 16]|uniref:hypothetical protein n=1 Tax=Allokutzneria sp. A3M-2-11 16 TaxID=2962043 RepID=UPI0020B70EE5|nr:hypothetical protein [Allokutzneria sp. A3M-2-11 16]MCP3804793.1 hypothetical protein [Allokutzneria sp. A3M-2-11 16]
MRRRRRSRCRRRSCFTAAELPAVGGSLYIQNVRKAATVSGVDVWGYDFGASGYQFSPNTNYMQFFGTQLASTART